MRNLQCVVTKLKNEVSQPATLYNANAFKYITWRRHIRSLLTLCTRCCQKHRTNEAHFQRNSPFSGKLSSVFLRTRKSTTKIIVTLLETNILKRAEPILLKENQNFTQTKRNLSFQCAIATILMNAFSRQSLVYGNLFHRVSFMIIIKIHFNRFYVFH